jgi:transglutaminase-like putative cysteine protease
MPVYKIQHITRYEYDAPVIDSTNQIKIYPYRSPNQQLLQHDLNITGDPMVNTFADYWGNKVGTFSLTEPHFQLVIDSRLVIQVADTFTPQPEPLSPLMLLEYKRPDNIVSGAAIEEILQQAPPSSDAYAFTEWCSQYVYNNFTYEKGITTVETTVDEILKYRKGVCQDFAHLLLQMLRSAGIPSRYVSGYICPNKDGLRGEGATHAWVEIWTAAEGWRGIDPTNNIWVNASHIILAVGRSFNDCSPAKGTFKGMANQKLFVHVSVGYEDGHQFEEHTQVRMHEERVIFPAIIPRHFFAQQQQQQQ